VTTTTYDQLFSFFGLRQNPFGVSPDMRFFFATPAHESTLAELLFAIQTRQGLMLLTGEAGAGKTTLLQQLLDNLHRSGVSSSYIFHSRLDTDDLFRFILQDFGVACSSRRKGDIIQTLHDWLVRRHSAGDTPVIIIDEAHVLPSETIDELRLLLNLESAGGKLVQILLAGQPELDENLRRPELRQLRQRVMFRCRLPLLTREETTGYIRSRLSSAGVEDPGLFPAPAVDAIFEYSKGIPRTINLLGEHAIINAYAEQQRSVTPESIRCIAADFDLVDNPLSVNQDAGPLQLPRASRFPLLDPEPRSLSALRLAYLSELPLHEPDSSVAAQRPAFRTELLSFPDTSKTSAASATAASTPLEPPKIVLASSPLSPAAMKPSGSEMPTPAASLPSPAPEALGSRANLSWPLKSPWRHHHRRNPFVRYWKEVGSSFQRDARTFYTDCASVVRGIRGRSNGHLPKPHVRHS
jgi:general secretion pathway protein A